MKANKETQATVNRRRGKRRRLWSRTKVKKKPKFLSLSANFPANDQSNDDDGERIAKRCVENVQIDEIKECHDHENVALFFSGGEGGATTLTGLLDATVAGEIAPDLSLANNSNSSRRDELSLSSASPTYGYGSKDPAALVRNALRSKERDSSEEKWVCYSEVVERKEAVVKEEEVTSSAVDRRSGIGRLSLKLDYEEILTVWSDKGRPLYIDAESSRIVPDDFNNDDELNFSHGCMSEGTIGLWTVPEMIVRDNDAVEEMKKEEVTNISEEIESKTNMEMASRHREASLLRYKEKRLNRLFSKTIRYQVRKLNAEKRPRLKGRFIKRS